MKKLNLLIGIIISLVVVDNTFADSNNLAGKLSYKPSVNSKSISLDKGHYIKGMKLPVKIKNAHYENLVLRFTLENRNSSAQTYNPIIAADYNYCVKREKKQSLMQKCLQYDTNAVIKDGHNITVPAGESKTIQMNMPHKYYTKIKITVYPEKTVAYATIDNMVRAK